MTATDEDAVRKALADANDIIVAYFDFHGINSAKAAAFNILERLKEAGLTVVRAPPLSLPHNREPVGWVAQSTVDELRGPNCGAALHRISPIDGVKGYDIPLYASTPATQIGGGVDVYPDHPRPWKLQIIGVSAAVIDGLGDTVISIDEDDQLWPFIITAVNSAAPKPQRAVARELPPGFRLVPYTPTQNMLDAVTSSEGYEPWTDKTMTSVYQEMLDEYERSPTELHEGGE